MSKLSSNVLAWTPVVVADATNFTDGGYHAIQGGSSTQVSKINEILLGGLAGASCPTQLILARDSTVGITLSGGLQAALDTGYGSAGGPARHVHNGNDEAQAIEHAATIPVFVQRFRRNRPLGGTPFGEIGMLGNVASFGEISLSCGNGGTPGALSSTIIFETQ